jgi:thiamine-phosphate pyrophosphorylase
MTESIARLYLVTPLIEDGSRFAPALSQACAAGEIAAVLLRLAPGDERASVNRVKALAPAAQEHGAAVLVTAAGEVDLASVATRGGADGVHLAVPDPNAASALRERLKDRSIGAGGLRSKDDAMTIGEAGIDYLMFGEPRADGSMPAIETVLERAAWWAEIFETPCVAFAPSLAHLPRLAATGAEFVALGDAVWTHAEGPAAAVRAALAALPAPAEEAR